MHLAQTKTLITRCLLACADNSFNAKEQLKLQLQKKKKDFTSAEAKRVLGTMLIIHLINPVNSSIYTKRIH